MNKMLGKELYFPFYVKTVLLSPEGIIVSSLSFLAFIFRGREKTRTIVPWENIRKVKCVSPGSIEKVVAYPLRMSKPHTNNGLLSPLSKLLIFYADSQDSEKKLSISAQLMHHVYSDGYSTREDAWQALAELVEEIKERAPNALIEAGGLLTELQIGH